MNELTTHRTSRYTLAGVGNFAGNSAGNAATCLILGYEVGDMDTESLTSSGIQR